MRTSHDGTKKTTQGLQEIRTLEKLDSKFVSELFVWPSKKLGPKTLDKSQQRKQSYLLQPIKLYFVKR